MAVGEHDTALLDVRASADGAIVLGDYRMGFVPDDPRCIQPDVEHVDLSGDGTLDPFVYVYDHLHEPGFVVFFEHVDGGPARELARLAVESQIMDRDGEFAQLDRRG